MFKKTAKFVKTFKITSGKEASMSVKPWKTISSRVVFQHEWYTLRRDTVGLPDGRIYDDYFVSIRPNVVVIFALTSDLRVLLIRQYKQGVQQITLELPAGTFKEETPLEAAERELLEETGYHCANLAQIGCVFDDASKNSNSVYIFLGTDAILLGPQNLDDNEKAGGVEVELTTLAEVLEKVRRGEIAAQSSVVSIYRALDELQLRGFLNKKNSIAS
jgi:ADP-ribose pyrophosphatase